MIKNCLIIFLFLLLKANVFGQNIPEHLCEKVFSNVIQPMKAIEISQNDAFSDGCDFGFAILGKGNVTISLEKYNTEEQTQKKMKAMLYSFLLNDKLSETIHYKKIKYRGYWDDSDVFENENVNSFALLRKQNYLITIFAESPETIFSFDKLLQKINIQK